jgi:hypothetical protein
MIATGLNDGTEKPLPILVNKIAIHPRVLTRRPPEFLSRRKIDALHVKFRLRSRLRTGTFLAANSLPPGPTSEVTIPIVPNIVVRAALRLRLFALGV